MPQLSLHLWLGCFFENHMLTILGLGIDCEMDAGLISAPCFYHSHSCLKRQAGIRVLEPRKLCPQGLGLKHLLFLQTQPACCSHSVWVFVCSHSQIHPIALAIVTALRPLAEPVFRSFFSGWE